MSLLVVLLGVIGGLLSVSAFRNPRQVEWSRVFPRSKKATLSAQMWPDVVDDVTSAIRAGLSLPQAVSELAHSSTPDIAREFSVVSQKYAASGNFVESLALLNHSSSDAIAQKFVAALTIAYNVGGSDLGVMLRTLSEVIRDDVKLRGEVLARQSWTINGARMAVAAPWVTVLLLSTRSDAASVYSSATGIRMLIGCAFVTTFAYAAMLRMGRLPQGGF